MGISERRALIEKIETERKSLVVTYITSTRPGMEVKMAMDCIRKIYDHIKDNHNQKNIDLFLMSNGGDGTVPWRLVTLIREFTSKFSVIIPYRAFSAATLTSLGADEIVMHPMGTLGPTDPTVGNSFNPKDEQGRRLGISVEDVTAYLALIKEDVGIHHEDELILAFNHLADKVHPLALGNVKRSLSQSRMMATKLLEQRSSEIKDQKVEEIVDKLTSKLYYHGHPINRKEAKEQIGLSNVIEPDDTLEKLIWDLYLDYEAEMLLNESFDPIFEFRSSNTEITLDEKSSEPDKKSSQITFEKEAKIVFIESRKMTDYLTMTYYPIGRKLDDGSTKMEIEYNPPSWKHIVEEKS
jgi:hypothetical protein